MHALLAVDPGALQPLAQAVHDVPAPSVENVPPGHAWHAVSRPSRKNSPALQHTRVPSASQCMDVPAAHAEPPVQVCKAVDTASSLSVPDAAALATLYEVPTGVVRTVPSAFRGMAR